FYRSNDGGKSWTEQHSVPATPPILTNQGITTLQQIDSSNAVGIGDLGTVLRTFDGGITWVNQDLSIPFRVADIHFSDPLTGIVVTADTTNNILTTSDGGRHWNAAPFGGSYFSKC